MAGLVGVLWGQSTDCFPVGAGRGARVRPDSTGGQTGPPDDRDDATDPWRLRLPGRPDRGRLVSTAVRHPASGHHRSRSYTYLATEIVFGALAFGLLRYAGALRQSARTIAALYPIAYLWDWYTLEIGVFEITMRTGYDLFGIPIEEHLFMIVVPALVLGIHETIRTLSAESDDASRLEAILTGEHARGSTSQFDYRSPRPKPFHDDSET